MPRTRTRPVQQSLPRQGIALGGAWGRHLSVSRQVALVLVLPALSMLVGEVVRDAYLMALEATLTLVTTLTLVGPYRIGPPSRRAWQWALVLVALGCADLIYNLHGPTVPRYPRNHTADFLILGATSTLLIMASRGWRRRARPGGLALGLILAMAALFLQSQFVLGQFMAPQVLPTLAVVNAWAYATVCSALVGVLVLRSWRAIAPEEHLAAQGLLLMLASDFAQRHDALGNNAAMGWGEAGWAAGLGLVCLALVHGRGQLPWRSTSRQAPWLSARCALGGLTFAGNMVLLSGALAGDLLEVEQGAEITTLLWLLWIGWFGSNLLALRLHRTMEQIGSLLPAPHVTWCPGQHPMTVMLRPIEARTRLAEIDGWVERYNQLVRQLNPLIESASRHHENHAYQRLAEHFAHDIRAPIAALECAIQALGDREEASVQVLRDAAARIHDVAAALLRARREQGEMATLVAHNDAVGEDAQVTPGPHLNASPIAVPFVGPGTPLQRVIELVHRDLERRHGSGWARAVALPRTPLYLAAPAGQLVAALSNLIDNAIEATPLGQGAVCVEVSATDTCAQIAVIDRGVGVPPHVLAALGQRSVTAGKRHGHGLGVLAVAHAATSWGGKLVYGQPPKGGTVAQLTVPLAQASVAARRGQSADLPERTGPNTAAQTVLVDDDPLVRQAWSLAAHHAGVTLLTYPSAQACIDALAELPLQTQFYLDTQLGCALTGHDLARRLWSLGYRQVVVMQSAGGGAKDQMEMGAGQPYRVIGAKHAPFAASA